MRNLVKIVVSAIMLTAAIGQAQQPTGYDAADSATVARDSWARAQQALKNKDLPTARREMNRAAAAWPPQPAYHWARALLAARASDTATTLESLTSYTALGMGRDLHSDSALNTMVAGPLFASVITRNEDNTRPLVRSVVRVRSADSTFWPEGVDRNPRNGHWFMASIRHRTVAELTPDGTMRELWPRDQPGMGAMMGVRVDAAHDALWVTTSGVKQMEGYVAGDSAIAALIRVRLHDRKILRRWNVAPASGGHVLGDLAVGPHGDVYITDSSQPMLYRLRPGGDTLETVTNPLFHSLQGLAPTPDGRWLYLSDYSHGLLRVDLRTNQVIRLRDAPSSTSVGCDGIAWYKGSIIAVQNGLLPPRITRFMLDPAGTEIVRADVLDRNIAIADEPTIGTIVGKEFVYVANSQWDKHDDDGKRAGSRPLVGPILLAVPITP